MTTPTLADAITQAGSPLRLLWRGEGDTWMPYRLPQQFSGWRTEQRAWHEAVALSDLSFHMTDTSFEGPDALRLLCDFGANSLTDFAVGQAKQYIPVARDGMLIADTVLLRTGDESFLLTGVSTSQSWLSHQAKAGGYDVACATSPNMRFRTDEPDYFRFQVQGPLALQLVDKAFGAPLPPTRFFHSVEVELSGRRFRALRHGMAGQPGYEFIGDGADHGAVLDALLTAGAEFGVERVGALAYPTAGVESGWVPTPTAAIYTDPEQDAYRRELPAFSFEGNNPHYGSFYSDDIRDYYRSPYELGYGRLVKFDHDFLGRDALEAAAGEPHRVKVSLVLDAAQVHTMVGPEPLDTLTNVYSSPLHRVEARGELVGVTSNTAYLDIADTIVALALVDPAHAELGTSLDIAWGWHPGPGALQDAHAAFPRIRAVVAPAPFDAYARDTYRRGAL